MRAFGKAWHEAPMHIAQPLRQRQARHLFILFEHRNINARGMARDDGDIGTALGERDAGRERQRAQVITVGAARPV